LGYYTTSTPDVAVPALYIYYVATYLLGGRREEKERKKRRRKRKRNYSGESSKIILRM
jgi:hypothetical protein